MLDDRPHRRCHGIPIEHNLYEIEPQGKVVQRDCDGVPIQIATPLITATVMLVAVDLDDEPIADQEINPPDAIDLNLRLHPDAYLCHSKSKK
jgi:hypothetical protein